MAEELINKIPPVSLESVINDIDEGDYGDALEALEYRTKLNAVEKLEHDLDAERLMLDHRKLFSCLIFGLSAAWLSFIGVFIWYFSCRTTLFGWPVKPVSDSVLIALITTTTANVLGYFYIVAKWLFPQKTPEPKKLKRTS